MRVCIVTHNVFKGDGQGRVNYELVHSLLSRGIEVELLADRIDDDLVEAGAKWTPIHPRAQRVNLFKVWEFARLANQELQHQRRENHIILACGFVLNYPHAINVAHFVHGAWLKSPFHSSRVRRGINPLYQWVYSSFNARWELRAFSQADTVVALSPMLQNELIEIGIPQRKIKVVSNGVDLVEFRPGPADRRVLGLPENVPLGLFAGDLRSPRKNLDLVLSALASEPSLHLAVIGDLRGSTYPVVAERLGLSDRVHFLGFRRDVADLMRGVDFFAIPSRRDWCPLVMLEAMASGLPIITSTTVGSSNLVTEDVGVVIDGPDDIDGMRASLSLMARQSAAVRKMGEASRAKAEMYSWNRMGDRYVELLEAYST